MTLKVNSMEFNMFGELTYIIWDPVTHEAAVVDPGMSNRHEQDSFDSFTASHGLHITHLINTHLHLDHTFGIGHIRDKYHTGVSASQADAPLGDRIAQQAAMFHLPFEAHNVEIDTPLNDGDIISIGNNQLHVIAVPGHSPGGIALYSPDNRFVISGDSLFKGSIGRTDLPGGDYATLVHSVTDRLLSLPDDTTVYPGHGAHTTIGYEKRFNPYL